MLSYQHAYHAGNFADVIKHLSLCLICDYLTQKDKPLFYLETHAGRGLYDLNDAMAQKTGEYKEGVALLWRERQNLPAVFSSWINAIAPYNQKHLRYYPGSPVFAAQLLRPIDRLYCCELHPQEFAALQQVALQNRRMHIHQTDGIASMQALLPPKEKRGLIFIDPSYEIKEEYKTIPQAIDNAFQRFSTGVFCLWYPCVNPWLTEQLNTKMRKIACKNSVHVHFNLNQPNQPGMTATGLWILNPPYVLAKQLEQALSIICPYFNAGKASFKIHTQAI
ncbi:MAG: 23S rRNA (adenine(2030)-N(6))-methyltransferase RlmJ [Legionellaceae bacterium]|nr:23S rRNA (adenine(2030)-N(6))-methyltransferase RlmJ [Legionellaceae bacterium]